MTRRDKCFLTGKRAGKLPPEQGAHAWAELAHQLEQLGETDLPKFKHLLKAIRQATITASSFANRPPEPDQKPSPVGTLCRICLTPYDELLIRHVFPGGDWECAHHALEKGPMK